MIVSQTPNMHDLSTGVSPPSLPSPTLTNPDMILPYNHDYMRISTPSPPPESTRPPSPPLAARALNSHPPFAQLARPPAGRRAASPMVTPPLESYSAGGLLPDIEEVETTPKARKPKQKIWRRPASRSPPLASSPTLEFAPSQHRGNYSPVFARSGRRPSNTISVASEESSLNGFENFDDAFSVDEDGIFPDEDEELSGSASEGHGYQKHSSLGNGAGVNGSHRDERDGKPSHVTLSRRAERILASAKRRLDHMEGNLSRARHSLIISPSPSMSPSSTSRYSPPYNATSPPSTEIDSGMILIHPPLGVSPAKHRQLHSTTSSNGSPGHSRVFSETSVPSSLFSSPQPAHVIGRSTSAQGMVGAAHSTGDGLGPPAALSITKTRSNEHFHANRESAHTSNPHNLGYSRSLSANRVGSPHGSHSAPLTPSSRDSTLQGHFSSSSTGKPPLGSSSSNSQSGISRSQSTAQMRDLRDQMKDLKGKISSLQQRAREDGLRRRSLQSLRTPSPFTAAEAWYAGANGYAEGGLGPNSGVGVAEKRHRTGYVAEEKANGQGPSRGGSDIDQRQPGHYEDAVRRMNEEDDFQGLGNSDEGGEQELCEPESNGESNAERFITESPIDPELQPSTVGERHEDRADAFDYEHFFLHSGVGNYELPVSGRRSRSSSCSSSESTSTTKILVATSQPVSEYQQQSNGNWRKSRVIPRIERADGEASPKPYLRRTHTRQDSVSSISTYATFATATEGHGSGEDSEDESEDEQIRSRQIMNDNLQASSSNATFGPPADTSIRTEGRSWPEATSDRSVTPTTIRGANSSPSSPSHTTEPNGKATPTSLSPGDRSTSSTPVGTSRSFPLVSKPRQIFPRPLPSTRAFLSGRSGRSGSLGAYGAYGADGAEGAIVLNKEDRALVEGLVETLKRACRHLNDSDPERAGDWRRRLEDARKLLEGDDDWKGRR